MIVLDGADQLRRWSKALRNTSTIESWCSTRRRWCQPITGPATGKACGGSASSACATIPSWCSGRGRRSNRTTRPRSSTPSASRKAWCSPTRAPASRPRCTRPRSPSGTRRGCATYRWRISRSGRSGSTRRSTMSRTCTCADQVRILAALVRARSTLFFAVPRVWEKLAAAIRKVPAEWRSDAQALRRLRARIGLDHAVWPASGAAPIEAALLEFFGAIGVDIFELWGMTENHRLRHHQPRGCPPPGHRRPCGARRRGPHRRRRGSASARSAGVRGRPAARRRDQARR